ncbi:hypothetical protein O181_031049 [Austropuccinia psidii MF-1]|uniref:Uncharacterized protein n=1 Tax=Austropuccinia psidii MF-1 TaxID=1389203 RepID=A0A9Q3H651_9BASI|nr:hypothetical protein [Austropuccinia psidii MF-1]
MKISHSAEAVVLDQGHYTDSIIELYGMSDCKPISTPLVPGEHLQPATPKELEKFKELGVSFQSAMGCINYLSTATRPDLSFAVSTLSQFLEKPGI